MATSMLEKMQVNLTLSYVVNNAATDGSGNAIPNPTTAEVAQNIVSRLNGSRMTANNQFKIAWGPAVLVDLDSFSANITVVLQLSGSNEYSVVTSGTDFVSPLDLLEDNLYQTLVPFQKYVPSCPQLAGISAGTDMGLSAVIHTPDANGTGLADFMKTLPQSAVVNVVGHSLGGALASALVLYLKNQGGLQHLKYNCQTFAAPTAGNDVFADYFNGQMPANAVRIWNKLDVVPLAWNAKSIRGVDNIYEPFMHTPQDIKDLVKSISDSSESLKYTQWGKSDSSKLDGLFLPDISVFLEQVGVQHIYAYIPLLGLGLGDIDMPGSATQKAK